MGRKRAPLILLAKIKQLELLLKLSNALVIPSSVVTEIKAGPADDPAGLWLDREGAKWLRPDPLLDSGIAAWDLGCGETAVLNWATQHREFEAIIDDRAARKCASIRNIPYRGTIGVILAAKKQGFLSAAKPICEQLIEAGLLIDRPLLEGALKLAGE